MWGAQFFQQMQTTMRLVVQKQITIERIILDILSRHKTVVLVEITSIKIANFEQ